MKQKTINIINSAIYVLLTITGITFIGNKIMDIVDELKVKTNLDKLPETEYKPKIKTTYPDEPIKDFNSWSQHIHQLNNSR